MESHIQVGQAAVASQPVEERRHTREDGWARALRYIVAATYVVMIINVFIFIGVAGEDYNRTVAERFTGPATTPSPGHERYLNSFVPIMSVGMIVGVVGALIHRKRTRRRRDRHYGGQLMCVFVSIIGLALYFILA